MDLNQLKDKIFNIKKYFTKKGENNKIFHKKSFSTLEKIIISLSIGVVSIIFSIVFFILPGVNNIKNYKKEIADTITEIYGEEYGKFGKKFEAEKLKKDLASKQVEDLENKEKELKLYSEALPNEIDIYQIASFLEDYSITINSDQEPLIINNISFGSPQNVSIPVNNLKQQTAIYISKTQLEEIFGKDINLWPNYLFIDTSQKKVQFVEDLSPKDFMKIKNNEQKEKLLVFWQSAPKISIPAEYIVLPINISIEAHKNGFKKFMEFVYNSGDLDNYYFKGKPVPVMSLDTINLTFAEEKKEKLEENKVELQMYSIKVSMYFQKKETLKTLN